MIKYSLHCDREHAFESWFSSGAAFDALKAGGLLECPACGSASVEKAIMAPRVASRDPRAGGKTAMTMAAPSEVEQAIAKLRTMVEKSSDYVGPGFAAEARRIHEGEAPERPIHGEARPEEARKLLEDGIPVLPLPFRNRQKSN